MIISPKNRFIFIKPQKVAGTSMEISLAQHCGEQDVITPITDYKPESDENFYVHPARNYMEAGFYNHMAPQMIKQKIGKTWDEYYKFTIVRNPYDLVVSRFFWNKRKKDKIPKINISNPRTIWRFLKEFYKIIKVKTIYRNKSEFEIFLHLFKKEWTSERYYFDTNGNPLCDFYIRYENLEEDYQKVCSKLSIPYEKLPITKNKQRTKKEHYSSFYNKQTIKKVEMLFKKELNFFNYKFEKE